MNMTEICEFYTKGKVIITVRATKKQVADVLANCRKFAKK